MDGGSEKGKAEEAESSRLQVSSCGAGYCQQGALSLTGLHFNVLWIDRGKERVCHLFAKWLRTEAMEGA